MGLFVVALVFEEFDQRMGGFFYDEMTVRWPDIDFETKFDMETYENETKTPIDFKSSCRQRRRDLVQLAPFTFYAGLRSTDLDEGSLKDLKANNRPSPKWPAVKTRPKLGLLFCDEITEDTTQCSSLAFRAAEILEQGAALVVICPPFLVRNIIKAAQESGKWEMRPNCFYTLPYHPYPFAQPGDPWHSQGMAPRT